MFHDKINHEKLAVSRIGHEKKTDKTGVTSTKTDTETKFCMKKSQKISQFPIDITIRIEIYLSSCISSSGNVQ